MSENDISITIDGVKVQGKQGQTILDVADAAGIYIPRLCAHPELVPDGSCRVCTVMVNGKPQAACTTPAVDKMVIENETETLLVYRRRLIEMLFVEGNHYCMFCEKSGNCELQALAYRFGMLTPVDQYQFPDRKVDATHPEIMVDNNRCIICGRCVRASRDLDKKTVFDFVDRTADKKLAADSDTGLAGTKMKKTDRAASLCPVGSIIVKGVGFEKPIGQRLYDSKPIGS